ncbi:hypothetical protein BYT27DRAFT_7096739 [Phlegmacium glaucopus]|nr:hypothetical protein BYT27DRAFT_7096739 [Phlegmacium glaucopus]
MDSVINGCALDASGNLQDASQIDFYESETDARAATGPSVASTLMSTYIATENQNSEGEELWPKTAKTATAAVKRKSRRSRKNIAKKSKLENDNVAKSDESHDSNYKTNSHRLEDSEQSSSNVDDPPSNAEIADILASKTISATGRSSQRNRRPQVTIEEVKDDDLLPQRQTPLNPNTIIEEVVDSQTASSQKADKKSGSEPKTKNPIYYFYEQVEHGADGSVGETRDKHYKCYHGNRKVFTLKKSGKSNLTTMVNNLKSSSAVMYQLFLLLKQRPSSQPITEDEITIASGKKAFDSTQTKEYIKKLEVASKNICHAFEKQAENATVSLINIFVLFTLNFL